jgi:DNA replication protein DnaC
MTTNPVGPDLDRILRQLKLSGVKDTLPERLHLARERGLSHLAFLEAVLGDELARRDTVSATLRARRAGLDPTMRIDNWHDLDDLAYDRSVLDDLAALRFLDDNRDVLILGPVGVGKTHLATGLGHTAVRRRVPVAYTRADRLFTRLRAARLDNSLEAEHRRLAATRLLIVDDFCLRGLDTTQTNDFYELAVNRHRVHPTVWISNRDPAEWLALTADTLLAQSAIDRLTSGAHTLIIDGPSYRQRPRPHDARSAGSGASRPPNPRAAARPSGAPGTDPPTLPDDNQTTPTS